MDVLIPISEAPSPGQVMPGPHKESNENPNVEGFVAWLSDYFDRPDVVAPGPAFEVLRQGVSPEDAPIVDGEKVYAAYGEDFYISPLAIFVKQDGQFVRIPWASVMQLFHTHRKAGYVWQFRTTSGERYEYCWGNSAPYFPFGEVVEECIRELGAKARETQRPGQSAWAVQPDLRNRERWFRDSLGPRYPELVPSLRAAFAAYDEVRQTGVLSAAKLLPIIECARSHRRPLYENASEMLRDLTAKHAEARDAVAELAGDSKATVRFNAIICLGKGTPRDFSRSLIQKALTDKSARVRKKAGDWAQTLELTELVDDLERAFSSETNKSTRKTVEFALRLLRDGYILIRADDEGYYLTVPSERGVSSKFITEEELKQHDLDTLVRQRQEDLDSRGY